MSFSQDILDSMSTGVVALDERLTVTAVNNSCQSILELSETRTLGLHASQLVAHPGDGWLEMLQTVLDTRTPVARRGMALTLLNGQAMHADLMTTPVPRGDSNLALLVELTPVDRLLRISREEGLLHAQETARQMVRGLAHEIKNPLGGVRGAAQLLAKELQDDELREYTGVIIREADRLRDLVDRLLGPNQQLDPRPLNVHQLLEHVRNLIHAEAGEQVEIIRDYDPSLPEISADRSQLIQALLNIVRNALQAADPEQRCVIQLRTRPRRQFTIGQTRHRLVLQLDIIDNGPGVPQEMQQTIFMPMVTGRPGGTGIGLSIAQAIVNRHGGLLECQSQPGNTRFTLYLPMDTDNDAEP